MFHGFDEQGKEKGKLKSLEPGGLNAWIAHAHAAMKKYNCFIWSLNTSSNPYFMRCDVIGTSLGQCNGYLYGFIARDDDDLLPIFKGATEDRERSVRYFAKDKIHLRYKMYCAKTKCFFNKGGLQDAYDGTLSQKQLARKKKEREDHEMIARYFLGQYNKESKRQRECQKTMEGSFRKYALSTNS